MGVMGTLFSLNSALDGRDQGTIPGTDKLILGVGSQKWAKTIQGKRRGPQRPTSFAMFYVFSEEKRPYQRGLSYSNACCNSVFKKGPDEGLLSGSLLVAALPVTRLLSSAPLPPRTRSHNRLSQGLHSTPSSPQASSTPLSSSSFSLFTHSQHYQVKG